MTRKGSGFGWNGGRRGPGPFLSRSLRAARCAQTGKVISAEKLGKVTWADHIDLATKAALVA